MATDQPKRRSSKQRSSTLKIRAHLEDMTDVIYVEGSTEVNDAYLLHEWAPLLGGSQYLFVINCREIFRQAQDAEKRDQPFRWPSQEELAARCGVDDRTVRRWFESAAKAKEQGETYYLTYFVEFESQPIHGESGHWSSETTYWVNLRTRPTPTHQIELDRIRLTEKTLRDPYAQNLDALVARYSVIESRTPSQVGQNVTGGQFVRPSIHKLSTDYPPTGGHNVTGGQIVRPLTNTLSTSSPPTGGHNVRDKGLKADIMSGDLKDQDPDLYYEDQIFADGSERQEENEAGETEADELLATVRFEVGLVFDRQRIHYIDFSRIEITGKYLDFLQDILVQTFVLVDCRDIPGTLHKAYTNVFKYMRQKQVDKPTWFYETSVRSLLNLPKRTTEERYELWRQWSASHT